MRVMRLFQRPQVLLQVDLNWEPLYEGPVFNSLSRDSSSRSGSQFCDVMIYFYGSNHKCGRVVVYWFVLLTHTRTGFIFRRIKSLFHHSNWQHIFLISFNGTSKRGVMHYK